MSAGVRGALLGTLASLFGRVSQTLWRRLRFRVTLPLRGVVTAHRPERLEVELRGRDQDLSRLQEALEDRSLVIMGGWAGIGKTALGRALGEWLPSDHVGIWVDCKEGMGLEALINALANYFGASNGHFAYILEKNWAVNPAQGVAAFVSALDREKNVLFLDDFHLVSDPVILSDLLPALRLQPDQARTVLLTREPDKLKEYLGPGDAAQTYAAIVPVEDLDETPSIQVLRDRGLTDHTDDELHRLYEKTGGHPKGLELCVALVKTGMAIKEIERLPLFEQSGDEEKSLRRILKETEERLSRSELRLLQRCSVFDEAFGRRAISYVFRTETWEETVYALEDRYLLSRTDDRLEMHPLLREYFYSGLKEPRLVHGLAGEYYFREAEEEAEASEALTLRMKAHHHFEMAEDDEQLISVSWDVYEPLVTAGRWAEATRVCKLGVEAARSLKDRGAEARFLGSLGSMQYRRGEWDEAIELYNKSLEISEQVGDIHGMAKAYDNLGNVYADQGEWDQAIELYNKDLEISEQVGDIHGMAQTYNNLGMVYRRKGEWDRAIELYTKSLEISEQVEDIHGMAQTYNNLGNVYADQGKWDQAIELYNKDLEISEQVGDVHGMAQTYTNLGLVYADQGKWDQAIELYNKALKTMEQVGDIHGMAQTYGNLGLVYADQGKWDEAIELYNKDLEISEQVGDIHGMAQTYGNLGSVYLRKGEWEKAIQLYNKSLEIMEQVGDVHGMAKIYNNLALVYADQGKWEQAIELYNKSLELKEHVGDIHGMAKAWGNLANVHEARGESEKALEFTQKALEVFEQLGSAELSEARQQAARIRERLAEEVND